MYRKTMQEEKEERKFRWIVPYVVFIIPLVIYFFLISKMAAFISDRYLFPIYAVGYVLSFCCIYRILKNDFSTQQAALLLCVVLAFVTYGSWKNIGWPYLYLNTAQKMDTLETYSDVNCIFIYSERFQVQYMYKEASCYDTISFVSENKLENLPEYDEDCGQLMVVINSANKTNEECLAEIMEKYPQLTQVAEISGLSVGKHYYLTGE